MTVAEAAQLIGCEPRWVRRLAKRGTLRATFKTPGNYWDLNARSVRAYADRETTAHGGRPRGVSNSN